MGESLVWVLGGEGNIPESITDVMCNGSSTAEVCFGLVFAECGNALTFEYPAELETLFGAGGEQKLVSASLSYIFVLE